MTQSEKKREYNRRWAEANREKVREANRRYKKTNPDKVAAQKRKRRYGTSANWWLETLKKQGGHCALCPKADLLGVDHDHKSGKPRGILCRKCNASLTTDREEAGWLDKAKAYLADNQGPPRALRFNSGKPQLFYCDMFPAALREVSRTLMYGTQREIDPYPRFNWCSGAPYTELYDCARRHMQDWLNGAKNDRDAEQQNWQVHNLAFAVGNLLRLLQQELDGRTDLDDRGYRQGKEPSSGKQG